jgi:hypothetical protein
MRPLVRIDLEAQEIFLQSSLRCQVCGKDKEGKRSKKVQGVSSAFLSEIFEKHGTSGEMKRIIP